MRSRVFSIFINNTSLTKLRSVMLKEYEYITIVVKVPNGLVPKNLQECTCGDNSIRRIGVSPNGRLRNGDLYLDSIELANDFSEYLHQIFSKRKYKDHYKIEIKTCIGTPKRTIKYKERDSNLVRHNLKKSSCVISL